jgi:uncharacterized Zn-finger protein
MADCSKQIPVEKRSLIVYHKNTHFPKYACTECEQIFPQKSRLEVHMRTAHTGEKPYKCTECERAFPQLSNLNDHVSKNHHSPASMPYAQFYNIQSQILRNKNPSLKYTQIISEVGKMWRSRSNKSNSTAVPGEDPGTQFTGVALCHVGDLTANHSGVDPSVEGVVLLCGNM